MERITRKAEIRRTEAVSDGPVPELHTDSEEEEPEEAEEPIEPGDHIFAIGLVSVSAEICYDFDQFRLYSRDQIQSVSDNAQASVQGAS